MAQPVAIRAACDIALAKVGWKGREGCIQVYNTEHGDDEVCMGEEERREEREREGDDCVHGLRRRKIRQGVVDGEEGRATGQRRESCEEPPTRERCT